jgi:phospholipid/cholesterol/gamma-HCH transport system substrate-binding protein
MSELIVGLFMLAGIVAILMLALKVSGLTKLSNDNSYTVTAAFDNIGDLKARSQITISGVRIGQVQSIELDPQTYRAIVTMKINNHYNDIPVDSSAKILTQGLLGSNYISITPGFQNVFLKNHSAIEQTQSAMILENLIGQLLFKVNNDSKQQS